MFMHGIALEADAMAPGAAARMLETAARGMQRSGTGPRDKASALPAPLLPSLPPEAALAAASDPSQEHVRALRSSARTSRDYLAYLVGGGASDGGDVSAPSGGVHGDVGGSAAEVARQLREQHRHLVRLVLHLATGQPMCQRTLCVIYAKNRLISPSTPQPLALHPPHPPHPSHSLDAEGDAARFLQCEAGACELRLELAKLRQGSELLLSEVSNIPRLQVGEYYGGGGL